jgi:hypothetical protein
MMPLLAERKKEAWPQKERKKQPQELQTWWLKQLLLYLVSPAAVHVFVHDQILSEFSISSENAGPVGRRQKNA